MYPPNTPYYRIYMLHKITEFQVLESIRLKNDNSGLDLSSKLAERTNLTQRLQERECRTERQRW